MPRLIREGIIDSKTMKKLSWLGQLFFYRLLLVIDDHARFTADTELVRTSLFPRDLQQISVSDVAKLLSDCEGAGLVSCYTVDGDRYLVVKKFGQVLQKPRKSKYPPPELEVEIEVEDEIESEGERTLTHAGNSKSFYLRGHLIKKNAGDFLREKFEARIEQDFMKDFKGLNMDEMLADFTDKAFLMQYKEESHVYNSFRILCKSKMTGPESKIKSKVVDLLTVNEKVKQRFEDVSED